MDHKAVTGTPVTVSGNGSSSRTKRRTRLAHAKARSPSTGAAPQHDAVLAPGSFITASVMPWSSAASAAGIALVDESHLDGVVIGVVVRIADQRVCDTAMIATPVPNERR